MQRPMTRVARQVALTGALVLALLTPAAVLAADPASGPTASAQESAAPTETAPSPSQSQVIAVDPSFITSSATPVGAVLSATGRPVSTPPATDALGASSSTSSNGQGLPLLLFALATTCLVAARLPEVRRR